MRIIIKEGAGRELNLSIPTVLMLNRFTAGIIARSARRHGVLLTNAQLRTVFQALRKYRKEHPNWTLVEAEDADRDRVEIHP